jgi:hypothetical protein
MKIAEENVGAVVAVGAPVVKMAPGAWKAAKDAVSTKRSPVDRWPARDVAQLKADFQSALDRVHVARLNEVFDGNERAGRRRAVRQLDVIEKGLRSVVKAVGNKKAADWRRYWWVQGSFPTFDSMASDLALRAHFAAQAIAGVREILDPPDLPTRSRPLWLDFLVRELSGLYARSGTRRERGPRFVSFVNRVYQAQFSGLTDAQEITAKQVRSALSSQRRTRAEFRNGLSIEQQRLRLADALLAQLGDAEGG